MSTALVNFERFKVYFHSVVFVIACFSIRQLNLNIRSSKELIHNVNKFYLIDLHDKLAIEKR